MTSQATNLRRSSFASGKTLVDISGRKANVSEIDDCKSSFDSTKSRASSSSLPGIMGKAMSKVKSKLGESSSKPKPKGPVRDSYPDAAYMWRALAETKI
ncbi:hypothetical protein F4677DRAFT_275039 [Hypoxylon crocopeplum]|nr:hypothetical protein F4677DRAFT_275039 [Hypoxylon crocopeplum]